MKRGRMEAFSDGVIAILITIMVLELKTPGGHEWSDLKPVIPIALGYLISFVYVAIYWNNHHHMLQKVQHVGGGVLWANNHLLFWLSLVPFATAWVTESGFAQVPMMLYGVVLLAAGVAYFILAQTLVKVHGTESDFSTSLGKDVKGITSVAMYAVAILLCLVSTLLAGILYLAVAIMWLIPDRRFAKDTYLTAHEDH
ncbi:MAG TPA: TMEM175 family protein [Fimbriimonas sp.]|nr:TMEM175 family protein [Fimbriimonas sp.]